MGRSQAEESAEPISVKLNMPFFVAQKQRARFFQHGVAPTRLQQAIISRADELRDDKELNLEFKPEEVAD